MSSLYIISIRFAALFFSKNILLDLFELVNNLWLRHVKICLRGKAFYGNEHSVTILPKYRISRLCKNAKDITYSHNMSVNCTSNSPFFSFTEKEVNENYNIF